MKCAACDVARPAPGNYACAACLARERSYFDREAGDELAMFQETMVADAVVMRREAEARTKRELAAEHNAKFGRLQPCVLDAFASVYFRPCDDCRYRGAPRCVHANASALWCAWKIASTCTLWRRIVLDWIAARGIELYGTTRDATRWLSFLELAEEQHGIVVARRGYSVAPLLPPPELPLQATPAIVFMSRARRRRRAPTMRAAAGDSERGALGDIIDAGKRKR